MSAASNPLVSVIISFLNEERFLAEAIESVLAQEYDHWELILVDDGSTDNSGRIALDYVQQLPQKIRYIYHEGHFNKGLSASRNFGVSIAGGELIAVLDADDIWLPAKLKRQVDILHLHPGSAMICEASCYWSSWFDNDAPDIITLVGYEQDKLFEPPSLLKYLYPLSGGAAPCPSGLIIRTAAFRKHGGFEEHFKGIYQLYEDQAFLHKIYLNEPVYISSQCNNKYRQREGSLVQKITQDGNYDKVRKYFLEWLEAYLIKNQLMQKGIHKLVDRALLPYRHPLQYKLRRSFSRFIGFFQGSTGAV
jgi:glycosyltransferase involved in cell wall biosynthesis